MDLATLSMVKDRNSGGNTSGGGGSSDSGWNRERTELLNETVTTVDMGGPCIGYFVHNEVLIDSDTITVTFDGTEYKCTRYDRNGVHFYGGNISQSGIDFTNYPFVISSTSGTNGIYTETAGTYAITVVGDTIVPSSDFSAAVGKCLPVLKVELGKTTYQEVADAITNGLFVYGFNSDAGCMFYALDTNVSSGYGLRALSSQYAGSTPTIVEFVASTEDSPLEYRA